MGNRVFVLCVFYGAVICNYSFTLKGSLNNVNQWLAIVHSSSYVKVSDI